MDERDADQQDMKKIIYLVTMGNIFRMLNGCKTWVNVKQKLWLWRLWESTDSLSWEKGVWMVRMSGTEHLFYLNVYFCIFGYRWCMDAQMQIFGCVLNAFVKHPVDLYAFVLLCQKLILLLCSIIWQCAISKPYAHLPFYFYIFFN